MWHNSQTGRPCTYSWLTQSVKGLLRCVALATYWRRELLGSALKLFLGCHCRTFIVTLQTSSWSGRIDGDMWFCHQRSMPLWLCTSFCVLQHRFACMEWLRRPVPAKCLHMSLYQNAQHHCMQTALQSGCQVLCRCTHWHIHTSMHAMQAHR